MRDETYWVVSATLQFENYDAFVEVVTPLVVTTRQDPGSLAYNYSVNADRTVVQIYESYRDSSSFVAHVQQTFSQFAEAFRALATIEGLVVYGQPDAAAKEILDGFGSTYMTPFVGYTLADASRSSRTGDVHRLHGGPVFEQTLFPRGCRSAAA